VQTQASEQCTDVQDKSTWGENKAAWGLLYRPPRLARLTPFLPVTWAGCRRQPLLAASPPSTPHLGAPSSRTMNTHLESGFPLPSRPQERRDRKRPHKLQLRACPARCITSGHTPRRAAMRSLSFLSSHDGTCPFGRVASREITSATCGRSSAWLYRFRACLHVCMPACACVCVLLAAVNQTIYPPNHTDFRRSDASRR